MRKLFYLLLVILWCLPSWATWTMVQHVSNAACPGTGTTCTITISSTGTGHLIVVWVFMPTATPFTNSISSLTCGGTYTIDAATDLSDSVLGGAQEMAYTLSSTSGTTSCILNYTNAVNNNAVAEVAEYSSTTSFSFDTSGSRAQTTAVNAAGVTLTLSGANDVIVQAITPNGSASAISGTYTNPADFPGGFGYAGSINTASGTAPTWTTTSGNDILAAEAFKESSGASGGGGFGGKSGIGGKAGVGE